MTDDPAFVSETYFNAWRDRDFGTLRSILADDVEFIGPFAHLDNAEDCVAGLKRMSSIVTALDIQKRFVDGPDVLTWFELQTSVAEPVPTANWTHVEAGKITRIRVAFDARPLAPPADD
jgi:hypothetical protein